MSDNTIDDTIDNTAKTVASMLLEIEAVKLRPHQPFEWASGWLSPIYCDNRMTLSFPKVRLFITESLAKAIKSHFPEATVIAGVATAGIPQAALVAQKLDLPMIYVRSKPKEHGTQSQIEGRISSSDKVVLIEDLISTGKSSLAAAKALQNEDVEVIGMAAIFTYGFDLAKQNFKDADIKLQTLSNYSTLIEEAIAQKYIESKDYDVLSNWKENPQNWSPST